MSAWNGKYVIGLTGNIATGKSVVRKMLEHLGAYGIDADALAHRAIARGAPGYQPIVSYFGQWILDGNEQIDRARLGRLVFAAPDALEKLESIVHPLVRQAIDVMVQRASQRVIVIEAIKLLEGGLHQACDSIWVTNATRDTQLKRLIEKRNMPLEEADLRIGAQAEQAAKLAGANVIIQNDQSFEITWRQVSEAWKTLFPAEDTGPVEVAATGALTAQRARPRQAGEIAAFITRMSNGAQKLTSADVMESFGEKAFMLLLDGARLVGLVGWQVENLVTCTSDFFIEPSLPFEDAVVALVAEVEKASMELQSEASLLFLPKEIAAHEKVWRGLGYESRTLEGLGVRAWQEAARDSKVQGAVMLFKQLRVDRVLRPI
jgi:dephospho-CoA kinase